MKKIYGYLRDYLRSEFHWGLYLMLGLFLAISLYANYGLGLERDHVRPLAAQPYYWLLRFLFFAFPFVVPMLLWAWCCGQADKLRQPGLWLLVIMVIGVLTFRSTFHWDDRVIMEYWPQEVWFYPSKVSRNIYSSLFFSIPMLWQLADRQMQSRPFGFTLQNFGYRPYLTMMLIMAPLLIWASYQPSFLKSYPRYWPGTFEQYTGTSAWLTVGGYELSYGLQFVFLEYFFRGFLVMAFYRYLGPAAILPMVSLYCWFHFGKPMAEAIGSIFGGYILGIIALRTRSIFGGILIHLGVAFSMELLAFLQKAVF